MSRRGADRYEVEVHGEQLVVTSVPIGTDVGRLDTLTEAERQVALDAAAGLGNAAIAKKRKRAVRTVANQLAAVYRKLGVVSRAELAVVLL